MKRSQLEHIIRAAATVADDDELIIIGSQAVLGQFPDAPDELCVSNEADVFPKNT
jgi:dihydrofolate reductase